MRVATVLFLTDQAFRILIVSVTRANFGSLGPVQIIKGYMKPEAFADA